jgi:LytR cell envelope-related transcriptional attenuator
VRTGDGAGAGGDIDPADLWVLDPATGEYRMRQPGEHPPPAARQNAAQQNAAQRTAARQAAPQRAAAPQRRSAPKPSGRRAGPAPGRASRRREPPARTGPWIAGALCFLVAVGGASAFALAKGSGSSAVGGAAADVAGASCRPTAPRPSPPATPRTVVEPPVSGSFLNGAKADPIDIRVTVLDGSGTFGQAEAVLEWMQNSKGYLRSSNGGPAPAVIARTTLVYAPNHVPQARALAAAMGLPASALHGDGTTSELIGRMVLTLGQDFHGIGKPFAVPAPAVPSAPATAGAGTQATGANGCGSQ